MPDDINMSAEQIEEEPMTEEQLEAAFAEDEDAPPPEEEPNDDTPEEDEHDEDEHDEDPEEDETSDEDPEEDEDPDEDDDDPMADIKARAAKLKEDQATATKTAEQEAAKAELMESAKADLLKDLFGADKIKVGDKEVDLAAFKEDYGEELDTFITARAFQIFEPMMEKFMDNAKFASQEDISAIKAENDNFKFMAQVAQTHPDVWKLNGDDKFWDWVDAQGDDTKVLMDQGGVDGTSAVISAYKKATVKATNEKIDGKAKEKLDKHKDLHKSTARGKGSSKPKQSKQKDGPMDDAERARLFNEAEVED